MSRKFEIMESAAILFARVGYYNATMDDIAKVAGVAKGGLYYHFNSKDELFISIIESGISEVTRGLVEIRDNNDRLKIIIDQSFEFLLDYYAKYPGLCSLFFGHSISTINEDIMNRIGNARKSLVDAMAQMLDEGNRAGSIRKVDYEIAAMTLLSIITVLGEQHLENESTERYDEAKDTVMQLLFNGIMVTQSN